MSTDINGDGRARLKPLHQLCLLLVAFVAVSTRRPDQILIPQFYAEDGTRFFAEAYAAPFASVFVPVGSYLLLVPRLVATVLSPLPWSIMPLSYSLAAAAITALVALRFLTAQIPFAAAITGFVAVVAVPSMGEPFLNLCCLHFILSLLIVLPFLEPAPTKSSFFFLALAALSGPEVLVVAPLALLATLFIHRTPVHRWLLVTLAACSAVQILVMLSSPRARIDQVWPPFALVRLYTQSVFARAIELTPVSGWFVAAIVLAAFTTLFVRNRHWFPAGLLIATAVGFLMAARSVNVGWPNPFGNGARYAYVPIVLLAFSVGWLAASPSRHHWRWAPAFLLFFGLLSSSVTEWSGRIPPNYRWSQQVEQARSGARATFRIPGPVMWEFPVPVRGQNSPVPNPARPALP